MLQRTLSIAPDATHRAGHVGAAVVGLGYSGATLLCVLSDTPDVAVRCICDVDAWRLATNRRRYPNARATARFERVLADPIVDAVVLATPGHTHYELAAQALEAGKHVLVGKPLSMSAEAAEDLASLAGERRCAFSCADTVIYGSAALVGHDPIESYESLALKVDEFMEAIRASDLMEPEMAFAQSARSRRLSAV
jgi:predicted dehydrogenase